MPTIPTRRAGVKPPEGVARTVLERVTRFELVSPLWESEVLPLNDTRNQDRGFLAHLRPSVKRSPIGRERR
jgi:hypothetical protein